MILKLKKNHFYHTRLFHPKFYYILIILYIGIFSTWLWMDEGGFEDLLLTKEFLSFLWGDRDLEVIKLGFFIGYICLNWGILVFEMLCLLRVSVNCLSKICCSILFFISNCCRFSSIFCLDGEISDCLIWRGIWWGRNFSDEVRICFKRDCFCWSVVVKFSLFLGEFTSSWKDMF